jgi:hypothetical protein
MFGLSATVRKQHCRNDLFVNYVGVAACPTRLHRVTCASFPGGGTATMESEKT